MERWKRRKKARTASPAYEMLSPTWANEAAEWVASNIRRLG
jgi:hypothetical protein